MKSFNFDHVILKPKEQIGLHSQPSWELSYIIKGKGWRTIGDKKERFDDGDVVLVLPDMPHQWLFDADHTDADGHIENISVTFGEGFLNSCAKAFPELRTMIEDFYRLDKSLQFIKESSTRLAETLRSMSGQKESMRTASLITLLATITESKERKEVGSYEKSACCDDKIKKIKIYVSCNFKRDISIDDIARHVGMNRSSLCTFFKHNTGKTLVTYLNEYRMEIAKYLLSRNETSISDVCYQSGFRDIPYFNRTFKRHTGVTPKMYRETSEEKR